MIAVTATSPTYLKSSLKLKRNFPAVKLIYPITQAQTADAIALKIVNLITDYFVIPIAKGTKVFTP